MHESKSIQSRQSLKRADSANMIGLAERSVGLETPKFARRYLLQLKRMQKNHRNMRRKGSRADQHWSEGWSDRAAAKPVAWKGGVAGSGRP